MNIFDSDIFEWDWKCEDGHMAPYVPIEELHDQLRDDGWLGPTNDIFHQEKGVWFKRNKNYNLINTNLIDNNLIELKSDNNKFINNNLIKNYNCLENEKQQFILKPDIFDWEWKAEDGHMAPYVPLEELHDMLRDDGWIGPTNDIFHPEKGVWFKRPKIQKNI